MGKLIENVKSIKNRCEIIEILWNTPEKLYLIVTVLEDIYDVVYTLIDEYCIEE